MQAFNSILSCVPKQQSKCHTLRGTTLSCESEVPSTLSQRPFSSFCEAQTYTEQTTLKYKWPINSELIDFPRK